MKKKIWFYLCIIQAVIIIGGTLMVSQSAFASLEIEAMDVAAYLDEFAEENNFIPDAGYIPDAQTAKAVGGEIIDNLTGKNWFGVTTVKYDEENRLWLIEKGYLFSQGGFVVIEQDSGRVIKALLYK